MRVFSRRLAAACALVWTLGCGSGTSGSISTTAPSTSPSAPTPTDPALPAPPAGCEAWPAALAGLFKKVSLPANLCLMHEAVAQSSEYTPSNRRIVIRLGNGTGGVGGEIHGIVHELFHAHQHQLILDAGLPDINIRDEGDWLQSNWMKTQEGRDYLDAGGYVFRGIGGACTRSVQPVCWTVNQAFCEMGGFCIPGYDNPMEDNAEFSAIWYNLGNVPMWSRAELLRLAPRRSAWAQRYLP